MKGGGLKWRARELPLMLVALVCTMIILWTWDRTPLFSTITPPESEQVHISSDTPATSSEVSRSIKPVTEDVSPVVEKENLDKKEEDIKEETPKSVVENPPSVAEEGNENLIREHEKNGSVQSKTTPSETEIEDNVNLEQSDVKKEKQTVASVKPIGNSSSVSMQPDTNSTMHVENTACNYAKGKWVVDDQRPLYSGSGCKRWLSSMWACRLMQRKDFDFEKIRWQPKDCEIEEFEGSKFLKRMKNKTLAFVGDSLGRQQFQSMMCMITGGKERPDVLNVGNEYGLVVKGSGRPDGWAYQFPETNTTVLYYWSASLCNLEPLDVNDPKTNYAMHLDRPPQFLQKYLYKIDVLVLNTGHHWNRGKLNANRWVMHIGGAPTNMNLATIGSAKNYTIHSIVSWVNSQLPKHPGLKAFYRSLSPRHFMHGDWNTGGSCDNTHPMSIGKEVLQDESSDYSARSAVNAGVGVKILDITALSQLRDEGHISRFSITASPGVQDCLHWCLPGVPDTWNEILFQQI